MKIAIISDSHDNLANLKKVISFIEKGGVKILIHCGDITTLQTLRKAFLKFKGEVNIVFGNADKAHLDIENLPKKEFKNIKFWGDLGELKIDGKKIAFLHSPKRAYFLAKSQKYDIVFYGHLHKAWIKNVGKTKLVNPGELAGVFFKPTFAIYNTKTDKIELKILGKLK